MTGFEPRTSGIGNNHSTNWATTNEHSFLGYHFILQTLSDDDDSVALEVLWILS